ncbi:hypothetical protein EDD11_001100 [Mortierella claussenii]|nr:hypothetical protein EDD11_001100 [Mortierella claussenii]
MTDNQYILFCLVGGEATPFSVDIDSSKTVDHLKVAIKDISLADVPSKSKEELDETDDVSHVFTEQPPKKTIHIIVQQPPPGYVELLLSSTTFQAPIAVPIPVRARSSTPFSDTSRPSTPLLGERNAMGLHFCSDD